ncbi:MAG: hypothetical protein C0462_01320 [Alcanivorax sp.]|nr:hypothetical protein [Alcanivorax sp.]
MRYLSLLGVFTLTLSLLSACGGSNSGNLSAAPDEGGPRTDTPDVTSPDPEDAAGEDDVT